MTIETTIKSFHDSIRSAAVSLKNYEREMDEKQHTIHTCIQNIPSTPPAIKKGETALVKSCNEIITQHSKAVRNWKQTIEKYISGKQFVNRFEKSLLVIVFADVKAGKSSLGNFISGYSYQNTKHGDLYTKPICYVYDYTEKNKDSGTEKVLKEGHFIEDEIQATASIQYFTLLDGLTWVDTPGIHSLTSEYENLAKEYIKYADLILFLTPSNNPLKMDEAQEIKKLIQCDKPLLVTITKSDTGSVIFDENNNRRTSLRPKSDENRKLQEDYVKDEIERFGGNNIVSQNEYISISTKLANNAMEQNDEELFKQSNMPDFFEQIGTVISEKAVALKMKRPLDEFNFVVRELLDGNKQSDFIGIKKLKENMETILADIETQEKKLDALTETIMLQAKGILSNSLYQSLSTEKSKGTLSEKEHLSELVNDLANQTLSSVISEEIGNNIANFQTMNINQSRAIIEVDFEKKKKQIEYEIQEGKERLRDPKGIIEHVQHFFGKEFYEFSIRTKIKTREIETGDNFNEFFQIIYESLQTEMKRIVMEQIDKAKGEYYGNLKQIIDTLCKEINTAILELEGLMY